MSSPRVAFRSRVVLIYVLLFLLAVTWPGATLTNRFEPQILGLPFNLAWAAGWVLLGFGLLLWLDRAVTDDESTSQHEGGG